MNKNIKLIILFIALLLFQIIIGNNILLFEFVNPYIYIVFVLLYPANPNRFSILTASFLLGLSVDSFSNSGGVHTAAILPIALIQYSVYKRVFQKHNTELDLINLKNESFGNVFNYVALLTIIHHLTLFFLADFSFSNFLSVIIKTLLSSALTMLLFFLGYFILNSKTK